MCLNLKDGWLEREREDCEIEGQGPACWPVRHPQDSSAVGVEVLTFASFEP